MGRSAAGGLHAGDGEVAFVGGIDLTSLGGDRFDTSDHPMRSRLGWHDASSGVHGPAVADVAAHFAARWRAVTGEQVEQTPPPPPAGEIELQVVRTAPEKVYDFLPRGGGLGILEAYTRALRSARKLVYLESQFLWSPQVVEILANKLREPPCGEFRAVVLLPAKPNNGADTTRGQLGVLARADNRAGRFLAATISARSGGLAGPLYVHAKIGIVDDTWLTVGSANLNEHSFFNDTEMNVVTCDPGSLARRGCGSGPSILSARSRRSPATPPASSMSCGARSPASSSSADAAANPLPTRAPRRLAPLDRAPRTRPQPARRRLTPASGEEADPYQSAELLLERSEALEPGPMAMRRQADLPLSHALTGRFLVLAALGHTPRKQSRLSRMPERA